MKNKSVIKYSAMSLILLILSMARVLGQTPFATGAFLAFLLIGCNVLILSPAYIAGGLLFSFSYYTLIGTSATAAVSVAVHLISKRKKLPQYAFYLTGGLSLTGHIPLIINEPIAFCLYIFFALVFMYVSASFFKPLFTGTLRKLPDFELICGGMVLCVIALGLNGAEIMYFPLSALFGALAVLLAGRIYGFGGCMAVGLCFGIGGAVYDYQLSGLAYYAVMSVLAAVFLPAPKIIGALSLPVGYVLVTYFFDISAPHALLWLAALIAGGAIYAAIPQKTLIAAENRLNPKGRQAGARYNLNLMRESTARTLKQNGEVFEEMCMYLTGGASQLNVSSFVQKVRGGVCGGCTKRCAVTDGNISMLAMTAIEKGSATVVDLPQTMMDNCHQSAEMLSAVSVLSEEFHKKQKVIQSENLAKSILSEQLKGMADVLKAMSKKFVPLSCDFDTEGRIKEEFNARGMYCSDVLYSPAAVTLVTSEDCFNRPLAEKTLSKALNAPFVFERSEKGSTGLVVFMRPLPAYDVVFASAGCAKCEDGGDTHSFIKIDGTRFLMALCDGMGSGSPAERFSAATISLIECFYRAGFDHAMVIKSVNRFLSLTGGENFSAADICVIDLSTGFANIFKIGTPPCYIKGSETVKTIEGSSLPIGMLDEIRPSVCEVFLNGGDMVVLVSDGVSDCFDDGALASAISCASDISPESLAKEILQLAKEKCGKKIRDDMTVTALRIFENK